MILIVNNYTENQHLGDLEMHEMGRLVKRLSGQDYLVKRFPDVSSAFLAEHPEITGVILGGCNSKWDNLYFDIFEGEFDLVKNADVPVLGVCAGHHLLAMAYGGGVRRVDFGKEERFFTLIDVDKASPLTEGLGDTVYCFQFHNCAVTELPDEAEALMSSEKTRYQAYRIKGKHQYGVQFHPELDKEATDPMFRADPDRPVSGHAILSNFLSLCS